MLNRIQGPKDGSQRWIARILYPKAPESPEPSKGGFGIPRYRISEPQRWISKVDSYDTVSQGPRILRAPESQGPTLDTVAPGPLKDGFGIPRYGIPRTPKMDTWDTVSGYLGYRISGR
ncbi:hypothetical protein AMTR_s00046p00183370 [Amborella trichopoda]|uniref:Uncharacterized protein n=1 Tax=Amborella trichopoda TaxID=13333 RepID=U5D6I0_AMBTC|nr:hypothetical protein AMTR_s00046p00183370 [Amborella trichopoda]